MEINPTISEMSPDGVKLLAGLTPKISEIKAIDAPQETQAEGAERGVNIAELQKLMEQSAAKLAASGTNVAFSYNESTNRVTIKVNDPKTGDLIREIPPRAFIRLTDGIDRLIGLILDKKS